MSEWATLRDRLVAQYPPVSVTVVEHDGRAWVELSTIVAPIDQVRATAALLHNFFDGDIGQLSESKGHLVLWASLLLDGVEPANLDEIATFLVAEAPRLRRSITRTVTSPLGDDYL